jgi:hypothetical protein
LLARNLMLNNGLDAARDEKVSFLNRACNASD